MQPEDALKKGMDKKSTEFRVSGAEVYEKISVFSRSIYKRTVRRRTRTPNIINFHFMLRWKFCPYQSLLRLNLANRKV